MVSFFVTEINKTISAEVLKQINRFMHSFMRIADEACNRIIRCMKESEDGLDTILSRQHYL